MATKSAVHEIVILGSHFSGLGTAQSLLRDIIPALSKQTPNVTYHVTIVAPHTEYFYNIPGPRYLVGKELITPSQLFFPIAGALNEYKADQYATVQGKATAVDPEKKVVSVALEGGATQEIEYQSLVIATGTTSNSKLWQVNDHEDITKALYVSVQAALITAKRVLVAGGGAVGVETAGEIATHYPKADITILSGSDRLLPRLVPGNSSSAESRLKALGVKTVHKTRVRSASENANGSTTVVFSDGTTQTVDVYIDATGGKPNTSFLPPAWLNSNGYVITDGGKTLRTPTAGVYALGDVADYSNSSLIYAVSSILPVTTSIGIDIAASAGKDGLFKQKLFKPMKDTQIVPVGPSTGVGQIMGWRVPGWLVWLIKSRTFFLEKAEPTWKGAEIAKA
ncbi:hypothetical protein V494_01626 [Pseudogymnoascus sp. VKM F-4513 (FW-928)]|nr:hypothetical protein V494_01626 [Pseudogymnoascus sp. VKM F-4513 (FW-928)]